MKTVSEVAKKLFPSQTWDSTDEMCNDFEKLAIEFAKEVIDEILNDPSMIYHDEAYGEEAFYDYEKFDEFKKSLK